MLKYLVHSVLFLIPTIAVSIIGLNVLGFIVGALLSLAWLFVGVLLTYHDKIKNRSPN